MKFVFSCLLFFVFLNWSCTKIDTTTLGGSLIPAVDNVHTFDTIISVIANNFDSVSTNCASVYLSENHVLGYISNDPYFGTTTASIYTQLSSASFPFNLPSVATSRVLDSAVLVLSYLRSFGDTTVSQKVNVYRFINPLVFDSSTCDQQLYGSLLGSAIYTPQNLNDSVKDFLDTSANELRIKLDVDPDFVNSILFQDSSSGFKSDSLFRDFIKGFAIVPDNSFGGNALTYYDLTDTNSKLALYYHYSDGTIIDTAVVNFRLTSTSATGNYIMRDHTGSSVANNVSHPAGGDNEIYIQTTPGTYAELKIPVLSTLDNRIINRAELVMDQVYSSSTSDNYFTPPSLLFLQIEDTASTLKPIPCDFNTLTGTPNITTLGGFKTSATDASGNSISRYTFDVTRYIQKIVSNKQINYTLKLSAPDYIINNVSYTDECNQIIGIFNYGANPVADGRVKLYGGNNFNPAAGMHLRIIYSKL